MSCQACLPALAGMFGALDAAIADGNLGDIALSAVSSYISASITSSFLAEEFSWTGLLKVAVAGGITSLLNNGKFGHGFISAGVGTALGGKLAPVANETANNILKGLGSIMLSGTISKATGGKFANGAGSAAFVWAVRAGIRGETTAPLAPQTGGVSDLSMDWTADDIVRVSSESEFARKLMSSLKVNVEIVNDKTTSSKYDLSENTIIVNRRTSRTLGAALKTFAHELGHVYQHANNINVTRGARREPNRQRYIDVRIRNEAAATAYAAEIYKQLGKFESLSFPPVPVNVDAFLGMNIQQRTDYLIPSYYNGKINNRFGSYVDYYGNSWDRANGVD
ncbi:ImmA/IrrE family metallo-endopeptidase [Agarilytica rhodophyticola]|uniref:ImmA/IrrE family metallo-endopeptidase n=1 Tax=Agarilytica rhodophyticola TaxID=1737490 RepID=UPI00131540E9|nr:ImmA/IrrE family metallo-endopeptidase [Agarilytica rhodophyticola]